MQKYADVRQKISKYDLVRKEWTMIGRNWQESMYALLTKLPPCIILFRPTRLFIFLDF